MILAGYRAENLGGGVLPINENPGSDQKDHNRGRSKN
jgi:hypothetical protein